MGVVKSMCFPSCRFLVEDGSGCGHVYVSDALVRECLAVPPVEWREACDLVRTVGQASYVKRSHQFQESSATVDGARRGLLRTNVSDSDRAKEAMAGWAASPSLQRTLKLVCQPFLSREEAERSVLGQRSHAFRTKGSEFTTLSLPRLQLRGMAVVELEVGGRCARECKHLMAMLEAP